MRTTKRHPLADWLREHTLSQAAFAKRLHVEPSTVCRLIRDRRCSAELALAVELATDGAVNWQEVWEPSEKYRLALSLGRKAGGR